jgi:DNA-binding NarL/FixJ family response regulator
MTVRAALAGAEVVSARDDEELREILKDGAVLLLVNRQLDYGFPEDEGVELIRRLRASHPDARAMLVSNFPDAQKAAVAAGALMGFGKRELGSPRVTQLLRAAMAETPAAAPRS